MGSTSFPSKEMGRFASFEARLGEDLSLQQIEEIEQQIMVQATDKTRGVAVGLLNRFDAKKPALIARQITMLDQAADPVSKIKLLTPLIGYLDPDAVDEKLDKIQFEANLSDDPKVRNAATQQLKHLKFAQAKPLVRDLQEFVDRLGNVVRDVLQTNSLAPMLNGLSAYQVSQVQQAAIADGGRS